MIFENRSIDASNSGLSGHMVTATIALRAETPSSIAIRVGVIVRNLCGVESALVQGAEVQSQRLSARASVVGAAGLEPATLCLEGRCSIRLSYAPIRTSLLILNYLQEVVEWCFDDSVCRGKSGTRGVLFPHRFLSPRDSSFNAKWEPIRATCNSFAVFC